MAISPLPLCYCTNVHPGTSFDQIIAALDGVAAPVAQRYGRPMGLGLWFSRSVIDQWHEDDSGLDRIADWLRERGIVCYTANAFPYGDFHGERVKDDVYRPTWADEARFAYTVEAATMLAVLTTPDTELSISTLPLGYAAHADDADAFIERCIPNLIRWAVEFAALTRDMTGRMIRLAIEPEPLCVIETTDEAIRFFQRLWDRADALGPGAGAAVREHVGLCYDVCHQAVEFESAADAIARLDNAGVRINKVQVSNALHVDQPAANEAARLALRDYVDVRYLHQTFGRLTDGTVRRVADLDAAFLDDPGDAMLEADSWRVHYHVPVNQQHVGVLGTTWNEMVRALDAVSRLDYAPHLEIETYTWSVMPGESVDLVAGLAAELTATRELLDALDG